MQSKITTVLFKGSDAPPNMAEEMVRCLDNHRMVVFDRVDVEFLTRIQRPDVDLIILSVGPSNDEVVERVLRFNAGAELQRIPVLVVSETHEPEKILKWMQLKAADCICPPYDRERLRFVVDSLTIARRRERQARTDWLMAEETSAFCCLSEPMTTLLQRIYRVANENLNILLTGETGSGKTRIARLIHEYSSRSDEPFVAVNCGSIPETLFESELFGHVKGSFTGAESNQLGKFGQVGEGTLLLDEIDSLPPACQAKLLHAVDDRVFQPLGDSKPRRLKASLVFASNKPIEQLVNTGKFRSDLYYRISGVELHIPPLRQRRMEIQAIAEQSIRSYAARYDVCAKSLSDDGLRALLQYSWPGNIRELQHVITRAMAFSVSDVIELHDLPERIQHYDNAVDCQDRTRHVATDSLSQGRNRSEIQTLKRALARCKNNRSHTAKALGISRSALYKKLLKYELIDFSPYLDDGMGD